MKGTVYWLLPLIALIYIGLVLNFVRKRRLSEGHALVWITTFVLAGLGPFFVPFLDRLSIWLGILYSPTLYLLVGMIYLMTNVMYNSLYISRLTERNRRLTQEVSILREQLERLDRQVNGEHR